MLMPTAPHNAVTDVRLNIRGASYTKPTALCNIFATNTRRTVSKTAKNRKRQSAISPVDLKQKNNY